MSWGSSFGMGKNDFAGGLARVIAKQKKKEMKKIAGKTGRDLKKVGNKWKKTNEGKLISGLVGGYMKHRTQINKGLNKIKFSG